MRIGICTNSSSVFEIYNRHLDLDVVQIATNFLDMHSNLQLIREIKRSGVLVQARSVLSSGLLSGKYLPNKGVSFNDPLRKRFTENDKNRQIVESRLSKLELIREFYNVYLDRYEESNMSLSQFVYSSMDQCPYIDNVLKGGQV
ncbi:aldo/keto reductase [Psychrosphaera algicola]|uniref:Aldo/keto reductase n=1 Tax=Psychrosphaera algicola TaxID=3023714 RepID=A0ABT5FJI2_9GAMM|nr:aldo/keto reductase [Psychrosphaera sp. G1-22]MDC2891353.1 aldo/keto reductase [Psychrosphaera sp. G1-22]